MAYHKVFNTFWFTPPRTATRSTLEIRKFFNFQDFGHNPPPEEIGKDYYFVSNFRNPYPRTVSIFNLIYGFNPTKNHTNFKKFVERKIFAEKKGLKFVVDMNILKITTIFELIDRFPDYLVKTENLLHDVKNLFFIKSELENPKLQSVIENNIVKNIYLNEFGEKPHWIQYYDEETANMLYDYAQQDFILGNYNKDSWKDVTS